MKYKWKKRPYYHQVAAVKKLLETGHGGALLMEPRTGKTKVCIDYASILFAQDKATRIVVFCPVGVVAVWVAQIKENCPYPHRILVWDRKNRQRFDLPKFQSKYIDWVIVNYDALSTPGLAMRDRKTQEIRRDEGGSIKRSRRGGRFLISAKLKAWNPDVMILDESHRIKSPSAKKSHSIHALGVGVPYRVIATGTVVTKSKRIFDIYSQWKFLNPQRFSNMTFGEFKAEYGRWVVMEKWSKWIGNRNEDRLHAQIHRDSYAITRAECYDLPRRTDQIIPVPLEESASAYDQMAEDMVARIHTGEITEASIRLVQTMRLAQITGGVARTASTPENPKGRLVVIGSEKLRAIGSRLEDLMEADEKVVIGAHFIADIKRLEKLLGDMKVPFYTVRGGVSPADRERRRQQFHKVSGGAVFIGQPSASSEGIDLSCASIMQWYSLTNSWVHYTQFCDRIALSERPTFYEFFLAENTVDELKYQTLLEDNNVGKYIIQSPELLLRIRNGETQGIRSL